MRGIASISDDALKVKAIDMDLATETASTAPQNLLTAFFEHLPHTNTLGQ
jgi:hypothetical protein